MRYSHERSEQEEWCRYLNDFSPFVEFIRRAMKDTERYITRAAAREHIC